MDIVMGLHLVIVIPVTDRMIVSVVQRVTV
jgi:hypothetical protein